MMLRHITVGPIGFDHQIQHLDSFIYVFQHDDIGFDSENIHLLPYVHHIRILSQWKCHWSRWHHYLELYTLTVYKLLCGTSEAKRHRDHCVCRPSVRPSVCPSVKLCFAGATCVPHNTAWFNQFSSYLCLIFYLYVIYTDMVEYLSILYDIIRNRRWYTQQRLIKSIVMLMNLKPTPAMCCIHWKGLAAPSIDCIMQIIDLLSRATSWTVQLPRKPKT